MPSLIACVLGAIFAFFTALYFYYIYQFRYWKSTGICSTKPSFPLGDIRGAFSNITLGHKFTEIYYQFPEEKYVGFWIMFSPHLLVRDPDFIKEIIVKDFNSFHDRGMNVNHQVDPLSGHLFALTGKKWKGIRSKLTPTFSSGKMKLMFPIMMECCDIFVQVMQEHATKQSVVDMKEYAACFTTDVISLCAFGLKANSLSDPNADFRTNGRKLFAPVVDNFVRITLVNFLPKLHKLLNIRGLNKEASDFFFNAFRQSMDYREQNGIQRADFFDLLIQILRKGKIDTDTGKSEGITFEEAAAQAFVFFAAGFETSSTTIQFALYEMAKNQEIQTKVREEIAKCIAEHEGLITYDTLSDMKYLSRVISETLRMYPPLPFLQRQAGKDYLIPGTNSVIPKDTRLILHTLGIHNDDKHFPNAKLFDPDRFSDERKGSIHPFAYLPFGEGPRNCIGTRFGLLETKIGLMILIKNFIFEVTKETLIPLVFDEKSVILAPKGGMYLKISHVK